MSCPGYEEIRDSLLRYPNSKLGFIVYRCTYDSNQDWEKFMKYLTTSVRATIEKDKLDDIADRLDWSVQQEAALLEGASFKTAQFQAWVASGIEAKHATSRHHACVMVTKESLDTVLNNSPPPEEYDVYAEA